MRSSFFIFVIFWGSCILIWSVLNIKNFYPDNLIFFESDRNICSLVQSLRTRVVIGLGRECEISRQLPKHLGLFQKNIDAIFLLDFHNEHIRELRSLAQQYTIKNIFIDHSINKDDKKNIHLIGQIYTIPIIELQHNQHIRFDQIHFHVYKNNQPHNTWLQIFINNTPFATLSTLQNQQLLPSNFFETLPHTPIWILGGPDSYKKDLVSFFQSLQPELIIISNNNNSQTPHTRLLRQFKNAEVRETIHKKQVVISWSFD